MSYLIDVTTDEGKQAIEKMFADNPHCDCIVSFAINGTEAQERIANNRQSEYLAKLTELCQSPNKVCGFNQSSANAQFANESAIFIACYRGGKNCDNFFFWQSDEFYPIGEQCVLKIYKSASEFNAFLQYRNHGEKLATWQIAQDWD